MIRLTTTARKLQALLSGAVSATEPDIVVCFTDKANRFYGTAEVGAKVSSTAGAAAVDICDAPDPATSREIDFIQVRNADSASVTVTIRYNDNGTTYKIIVATLLTGEHLHYSSLLGWRAMDVNGNTKVKITSAAVPWETPGTIGSTTPNTGAFTTLSASGLISADGGQIKFPATQSASADANTLDDYEEGTWTPAITFATLGNLSVSYSEQLGEYTKIGREVAIRFSMLTSAFTHTTAAGELRITGLPFVAGTTRATGSAVWQGITKVNYTDINLALNSGVSYLRLQAMGSGQTVANIAVGDMPTGGSIAIFGAMTYRV